MTVYVTVDALIGGSVLEAVTVTLPGLAGPQRVLKPADTARATVHPAGDLVTVTPVFPNADGSGGAIAQPLVADADGRFTGFVAQPAALDVAISGVGVTARTVRVGYPPDAATLTDVHVVASDAAMLAIAGAHEGTVAVRTDLASAAFMHNGGSAGTDADWTQIGFIDVVSVNARTGVVVLTAGDVGAYPSSTRLDQIVAPTAVVSLNSQRLVSVADPTGATDGLNLRTGDARYQPIGAAYEVATSTPYTSIEGAGHSYMAGFYATSSHGYFAKLAAMLGFTGGAAVNRGVGGASATGDQQTPANNGWAKLLQDLPRSAGAGPYLPASSLFAVQFGLNDLANIGSSLAAMEKFKSAMRVMLSRVRAAGTGVFENGHASVASAGSWATLADVSSNSGAGMSYTAAAGDSKTITVPADFPGGTVAIGVVVFQQGGVTYTFTVDGEDAGTLDTHGLELTFPGKSNNAMGAVHRITNLAAGAHTITMDVQDIAASSDAAFDYWQIEAPEPPVVLLLTQPRLIAAGYLEYTDIGAAFTPGDNDVHKLNQAIRELAQEFDDRVHVVELDVLMGAQATYFGVSTDHNLAAHPNDAGHSRIAAQLLRAVTTRGAWLPTLASAS